MIALLLALWTADARPLTYCVGGYSGTPPSVQAACNSPAVRSRHSSWHEHFWVTNGRHCMVCYDEIDDSCKTDWLPANPGWRESNAYACRNKQPYGDAFSIFEHRDGGEVISRGGSRTPTRTRPAPTRTFGNDTVQPAPTPAPVPVPQPPPPPPRQLTPELEVITPGPYAVGDRITVRGSVDDGDGERSVAGGTFEVYDGDDLVASVPATVQRDGSARAEIELPSAADVRVRFVPTAPQMNPGDTMVSAKTDPLSLTVDTCALRARVILPQPGQALASGQSVTLEAALFDRDNHVPQSATGAQVRFTVAVDGQPPAIVAADADLTAQWTPPAATEPTNVEIFATGNADGNIICHADSLQTQFSDLGMGFDTSGMPQTCYTGLDCEGEVVLQRPAPGVARQAVDELLADPATEVVGLELGTELFRVRPSADDRYAFSHSFDTVRGGVFRLEIRGPNGTIEMPPFQMHVRPALVVNLPETLDLGVVPAGSSAADYCTDLDFSQSTAVEEHEWELLLTGAEDCRGEPVLATTVGSRVRTYSLDEALRVEALDPDHLAFTVCLDAPRCAGEVAPDGVQLHVRPLTPVFADQARSVNLTWEVTGRAWIWCHLWWMVPAAGALFFVWAVLGFIRPSRFPTDAAIRVAGREKDLKRVPSLPLRDLPGSGAGFYRDAQLGVHLSGDVNGKVRAAGVILKAVRGGGVVLTGTGPLEMRSRRGRWEPVEDLATGHIPSRNTYRIGESLYFKVEAG